jgi:basic membrane lipoprotein Med (substrate-binding protein (PBP1-ABC) superfamily)
MAETAEIMAEEMQSPKKVAFANRKYTNEEKRKMEEEELEQLLKEQRGEVEDASPEQTEESEEPTTAEEKTFKKRYSDLRRHQQKQAEEFKTELAELKRQLSEATQKEMKLPKSDEDIEQWAKDYPDVAAIVETIAMKKAREQSTALEERLKAIDEMQLSATKEKAEAELMRIHPDFDEIRDSDEFHEWAETQPKWVQDALYDNDNDARSAARAIDLYKADMGMSTQKPKSDKDAAKSVSTKNSRSKPQENEASTYLKESQVQKMSPQEYEKRSDEIMEAIRSGKFVYDVSGSAR